ncbi:MAG: acetyl-CoA decarbonylase/synthase complex subunit gamma [Candidatus Omnitrophica bacterium]|nr:acetyl-CoA decarbonylase/synthase complex subunit gamma [Candidatus Omnitrophota bacterium]
MALSGLDIYKLLPKTNCRECGFPTCLAFAMQLAKKAIAIDKCPYLSKESRDSLEASSLPPIRLISIGEGEGKLEAGNETVLFRHEEKFHHPCGLGFILEDSPSDSELKEALAGINKLKFERIGQALSANLVAVRQNGDAKRFCEAVKVIRDNTGLALVLMAKDTAALKESLKVCAQRKPLLYRAGPDNPEEIAKIALEFKCPLVILAQDLEGLSALTTQLNSLGVADLVLDTGRKPIKDKLWDFTQARRQALKKANRSLGYPLFSVIENDDPYEEAIEAATYICKYGGIVLIKGRSAPEVFSLLTLRQNIYTDPQKPLQIEPKLYSVGQADAKSPVMVTTNFSLTYYTVLGEVEASKVPAYILSVDTEGMSVLTAWAAEKFTPDKILAAINKSGVKDTVKHNNLIIPGYVAVMSGDLEESSGWKVLVGPKEAAGLPSFLKNL